MNLNLASMLDNFLSEFEVFKVHFFAKAQNIIIVNFEVNPFFFFFKKDDVSLLRVSFSLFPNSVWERGQRGQQNADLTASACNCLFSKCPNDKAGNINIQKFRVKPFFTLFYILYNFLIHNSL